jgi:hypothetical protein
MSEYGLDLSGTGQGPGFCRHSNKSLASMKRATNLECLSEYQLF